MVAINGVNAAMTRLIADGKKYPTGWSDREKAYQRALEVLFLGRTATDRVARVGNLSLVNVDDIVPARNTTWTNPVNRKAIQNITAGLQSTLSALHAYPIGRKVAVWYSFRVGRIWVVEIAPQTITVGEFSNLG